MNNYTTLYCPNCGEQKRHGLHATTTTNGTIAVVMSICLTCGVIA